jgi:uncharacterized protein YhjY with autotransporter beta-barrel domain
MKNRLSRLRLRLPAFALQACLVALTCLASPSVLAVNPNLPDIGNMGQTRWSNNQPSHFSPNVFSGEVTRIEITVPPQHGVAEVRGLEMIYTPNPGYVGGDGFYYTAYNNAGRAWQDGNVALMINPPQLSTYYPQLAQGRYGEAYDTQIKINGGSEPYRFSVVSGALAPGVTLSANGQLSGVPTVTGNHAFSVRVVDAWGFEATTDLVIPVARAYPDITVGAGTLSRVYGDDDFELPLPQSNSPGEFTFTSSNPAVATINGRTVTLVGEGYTQILISQAATDNYEGDRRVVMLFVGPRPDPAADAQVVAGIQAQVDASQRFAQVQGDNIHDRLRQVRNGSNSSRFNVALAYAGNGGGMALPLERAGDGLVQTLPQLPAGWGLWAAGTATFGRGRGGLDFDTGGLSVGADRAVGERVLLGMAGSVGRQQSESGDGNSTTDADQRSLALYGLWRAGGNVFVDAMLAAGTLDFDLVRWNAQAGDSLRGRREGEQWFGALTLGYDHQASEGTVLTGYGRVQTQHARLDAYQEQGAVQYALAYGSQAVRSDALAIGIEGSHAIAAGRLQWRPFWNLEYRRVLEGDSALAMNYVRKPRIEDYRLALAGEDVNTVALGGGIDLKLDSGWLFSLQLGHEQGGNSLRSNRIGVQVRYDMDR